MNHPCRRAHRPDDRARSDQWSFGFHRWNGYMVERTVVVTDHDFGDLSIERTVLGESCEVLDLTHELRTTDSDAATADILRDAEPDGVLNLRYELGPLAVEALADVGCRIIARYGIGVDNVATDAAVAGGIYVSNVPGYCDEEVATHAMSLILALARQLPAYNVSIATGEWDREVGVPIHRLSEQTIGIVGFGAIGRTVSELATAFGAEVIASDPYLRPEDVREYDVDLVSFEVLLEQSEYITIHSPLTDDTRGLFDKGAFDRMKPEGYLVNVARGPIVRHDAIVQALDEGQIAGAALDVFPDEPPDATDPLRDHDRVLTTPHVAWYSEEANIERRRRATAAVRTALDGGRPDTVINDKA